MSPPPRQFQFFRTLPGRLFLLSSILLLFLRAVQLVTPLPEIGEVFRRVVSLGVIVSAVWLVGLAIAQNRRRLLWRVRRKLILSYVFLGVVPVVLVMLFVVVSGWLLYTNVTSYLFRDGLGDFIDDAYVYAESSAVELGRSPAGAQAALDRKYANLATTYPQLSMAVVPIVAFEGAAPPTRLPPPAFSGPWRHLPAPTHAPFWLTRTPTPFRGLIPYVNPDDPDDWRIVIRAAVPTPDGTRLVIADIPVDTDIAARLHDRTETRIAALVVPDACGGADIDASEGGTGLFRQTVVFMDCTNWTTGLSGRVSVGVAAAVPALYGHFASAQPEIARLSIVGVLGFIGVLLMVIQISALVVGGALARMITSAVHELFVGTERVREGDFAHRINIESRDQLGDLADSFNRMSASIEHLLHVQREKQRLDDELRIARDIQKSLLPIEPPRLDGLDIADLCEPAREVGGDYYDFFDLGPRRLGILIADVSGKGTSAALYMAELKGLMLAVSQMEHSPRRLLMDVNRRLAGHLDSRSFITMTYAVLDLDARTLTSARAGHTPMIVASGGHSEVIVPAGMVIGLRFPGAEERFDRLLEEHTRPIRPGDAIVLYTDGITEAMDTDGELFGDSALAQILSSQHHLEAAGIRERVLREVKAFVGDAEPHDDMTMIVLKIADDEPAALRPAS